MHSFLKLHHFYNKFQTKLIDKNFYKICIGVIKLKLQKP